MPSIEALTEENKMLREALRNLLVASSMQGLPDSLGAREAGIVTQFQREADRALHTFARQENEQS